MKLSQFAAGRGPCLGPFFCASPLAGAPNDAQIAAIVVTANQVDIDAGQLAKSTSKTKEVQDFAQLDGSRITAA